MTTTTEYALSFPLGRRGWRIVAFGSRSEAELYTHGTHAVLVKREITSTDWEPVVD